MIMRSISLNDLFDYGFMIYQDENYFKFSIDSVLLAEFVSVKKNKYKVLDLCSGNFPVPMILYAKYGSKLDISAIELQDVIYDLGVKSLEYNKIFSVKTYNADVINAQKILKGQKFNIITCNPPYFKLYDEKVSNDNQIKAIARHELKLTLEDVFKVSAKLLENQGSLYLVHRPERLAEIIFLSKMYCFGVKELQMIYDNRQSKCCFILLEFVLNGKDYVKINKPVFLDEHTSYKDIFAR